MIILTIVHLFGVVLGFGSALTSDFLALTAYQDGKLNRSEIKLLSAGGNLVWLGLALIFLSGLLMFLSQPLVYLASTKFLAKMLIVGAVAVNGLFLHLFLLRPMIKQLRNVHHVKLSANQKALLPVLVSISFCSWFFALVLGSLRAIALPVSEILGLYLVVIIVAIISAKLVMKTKLLGRHL